MAALDISFTGAEYEGAAHFNMMKCLFRIFIYKILPLNDRSASVAALFERAGAYRNSGMSWLTYIRVDGVMIARN